MTTAERISEIRIVSGDHPVSDAIARHASVVEQFAEDIANRRMSMAVLAEKLAMLTSALRKDAALVRGVEDAAKRGMERV